VPFSPEELLARSIVITRRATGTARPILPTIRLGEIEIDIVARQVRAGESTTTPGSVPNTAQPAPPIAVSWPLFVLIHAIPLLLALTVFKMSGAAEARE